MQSTTSGPLDFEVSVPVYSANRTDNDGRWCYDRKWLLGALQSGLFSLSDERLQSEFLDYIEKLEFAQFFNRETKEFHYAAVPKRGNRAYAIKKGMARDRISEAMSKMVFDEPVQGFRNRRRTKLLFVTLTFDPRKFTREEAWASLKSTNSGFERYNVINRFDANISKIFGTHGKLVSKEAQANGYPAPHMLIVLDEPVTIVRKKSRGNLERWIIDDPVILKRLGKDRDSRALGKRDYKAMIDSNPVWKNGFFDVEGVVSNQKFGGRKNVCSYLFKYLSKCITGDQSGLINSIRTIDEVKDHNLKVALYTHFSNKCFCNRDITYGKGFRERIGLMSSVKSERKDSPWEYQGNIDAETYDFRMELRRKHLVRKRSRSRVVD